MAHRIYRLEDQSRLGEICQLFANGLGETTEEYWKWRIFTPNGQAQPELIVAEDESGRIIGVSSVLPELYGNRERKCAQLCDWVIHPDFRGQGLVGKLYRYAHELYSTLDYDFLSVYPNDNSYPIFQNYGFEEKEPIGSWNTPKKLFSKKRTAEDFECCGLAYRFTDTCPVTAFRQRSDRMYRTPEFMHWKYDLNPDTKFQWLSVWEEENLLGYFVFTCTHGRLRTAVNVYDWDFDPVAQDAFRQSISLLSRLGNYVSIWGRYGAQERALLERAGMALSPGGTRLMLKALSKKGWPEPLTLTRLDTDY